MNKSKIYTTFILILIMPILIFITSVFFPAESRKEELAKDREVELSDKFISGYTLNDEEISYLRKREFKYLIRTAQKVYIKDKGAGYALYKRAISIGVQSQYIYVELAQLYVNRNENDKAIALYEKTIQLDPKLKNWYTRGCLGKIADLYYSSGNFYKASEYYEQNLKYYPKNISNMYYLAACYTRMREVDKALNMLNLAIRIDPGNKYLTDIYNLMGIIYEKKNMLGEAERYYSESLRVNPKNEKAAENLIQLQKKLKEKKI